MAFRSLVNGVVVCVYWVLQPGSERVIGRLPSVGGGREGAGGAARLHAAARRHVARAQVQPRRLAQLLRHQWGRAVSLLPHYFFKCVIEFGFIVRLRDGRQWQWFLCGCECFLLWGVSGRRGGDLNMNIEISQIVAPFCS